MTQAMRTSLSCAILLLCCAASALAANKVTIQTTSAYIGEREVSVDVYARNEVGLLEYFNLVVFDNTRLEFASIDADRGVLWYGANPTHVDGDHIYVHGVASAPDYCMPPDTGDPGSPLYHITFNVRTDAAAGSADLVFSSDGAWDGHWNDCSGYQISPYPDYYDGAINVLGHAGKITVGHGSAAPGGQAVIDVYMHNDLDVFEYFNQVLFDHNTARVDSVVAARGLLHYGNYPTHVSGDTVFVHGWAGTGGCFSADHGEPGAVLYRIYFTVEESASAGTTMALVYSRGDFLWNHWVGCDLTTSDAFEATDGSLDVIREVPAVSRVAVASTPLLLAIAAAALWKRHCALESPV